MKMTFTFPPSGVAPDMPDAEQDGPDPAWVSEVEQRVIDRVDAWLAVELDERVIEIVEDKLRDETERRSWRRGVGVF